MSHFPLICVLVLGSIAGGCSRSDNPAAAPAAHAHEHNPPHGGTAIVLGEENHHLELVHNPAAGVLTAYVLDGHMENFVRINVPSFEAVARVAGGVRPLTFRAVASAATGETVGDTSQFEAQADWLKTVTRFDGTLKSLTVRGRAFNDVAFRFPEGNERP